jgi:DNA repair protein RadD
MQQRPYQQKTAVVLRRWHASDDRSLLLVSPTGSGKSVMGAVDVRWLLRRQPHARVLWFAHRIELIKQAANELERLGLDDIGIWSGSVKSKPSARVLVASMAMFHVDKPPAADFIVVDEAHRVEAACYQTILRHLPNSKVLGLTATPWRLDGKGLGRTFDRMHVAATMTELIVDGYIARPLTYGVPKEKARQLVEGIPRTQGDYAVGRLAESMMRGTLMGNVVHECARLAPGQPTLVFAVNRQHGRELCSRFLAAGRPTEYLDGDTDALEREAIVGRLSTGQTQVVVNVDVLTEGFDCPPVKCIVMARPTRSLTRFLQFCGRAARPVGDNRAIIIDHAGNSWRFGLPEAEHEWSLSTSERGDPERSAPVKLCCVCGAMIASGAHQCPECGTEQPVVEREMREQSATLQLLTPQELEASRRRAVLDRIAAIRGLSPAWVETAMTL